MTIRVLGVDPGTVVTGYACVELSSKVLRPIDLGIICPRKSDRLSQRYHTIFEGLKTLIARFRPDHIALETPFVQKNIQSAIKLGGAMGCILVVAEAHAIQPYAYAPTEVRRGVIGKGSATKEEILSYLTRYLRLDVDAITKLDATDALAVAVHHLQEMSKLKSAIKEHANLI